MLGNYALPLLLYADDLAILSHSEEGLVHLMDVLQAFCQSKRLTVNIKKTKAIIFSGTATGLTVTYEGQQFEQVRIFKYLGLELHQSNGIHILYILLTSRSTECPFWSEAEMYGVAYHGCPATMLIMTPWSDPF